MSNRLDDPSRVRHPKRTLCGDSPTESHESEVPRLLFALTSSQRGWHQRDPSLRLGIPNLAELRRFLPRQTDIAAQSRKENLPRLAVYDVNYAFYRGDQALPSVIETMIEKKRLRKVVKKSD